MFFKTLCFIKPKLFFNVIGFAITRPFHDISSLTVLLTVAVISVYNSSGGFQSQPPVCEYPLVMLPLQHFPEKPFNLTFTLIFFIE